MKIAVMYSGQFRTLDSCFENHVSNLIDPFLENGHDVDIFASLHAGNRDHEFCLNWMQEKKFRKFELVETQESNEENFGSLPKFGMFENWLKQIYSLKNSFKLIESDYDLVVRCRTDLLLSCKVELVEDLIDGSIFIPDHDNWTGYNDRFAMGTYEKMKIYCDLCENLSSGRITGSNAESYLRSHLDLENVSIKRTRVEVTRLRLDGQIEPVRYS